MVLLATLTGAMQSTLLCSISRRLSTQWPPYSVNQATPARDQHPTHPLDRGLFDWPPHESAGERQAASGRSLAEPQESVLGPILFIMFVNHLASNLFCQYKIFANDMKIYMRIPHDSLANYCRDSQTCQRDITMLQLTAEFWCLFLNTRGKWAVIRFERKSQCPAAGRASRSWVSAFLYIYSCHIHRLCRNFESR